MAHQSLQPADHGPYFAGDALDIKLEVRDLRGAEAYDLTGATIDFTVKENQGATGTLLTKSSSNTGEITIDDAANGKATIHIDTGDTTDFVTDSDKKSVYWFIQVTDSDSRQITILHGDWEVHNQ